MSRVPRRRWRHRSPSWQWARRRRALTAPPAQRSSGSPLKAPVNYQPHPQRPATPTADLHSRCCFNQAQRLLLRLSLLVPAGTRASTAAKPAWSGFSDCLRSLSARRTACADDVIRRATFALCRRRGRRRRKRRTADHPSTVLDNGVGRLLHLHARHRSRATAGAQETVSIALGGTRRPLVYSATRQRRNQPTAPPLRPSAPAWASHKDRPP